MLSSKALKELQELFSKQFVIQLSDEEVRKEAVSFMKFMQLIIRPVPKKDQKLLESLKIN